MKMLSIKTTSMLIALLVSLLVSCQKSENNDQTPGPITIQKVIPQALIDSLRNKGMRVNEGQTPPSLEGVFDQSPVVLTGRANEDDYPIGKVFADYRWKFYEQNTTNNTIKMSYKSLPDSDVADGLGAYIFGANNLFTIISENQGSDHGISYTSLTVISGEMTTAGIRTMQLGFVLKSKSGDSDNQVLLPVGQARVFKDGDELSERTDQYRIAYRNQSGDLPTISHIRR